MTQNNFHNIEKKTGKTLEQWVRIAKATPYTEQHEVVYFLQAKCGLTAREANVIAVKVAESSATKRRK